MGQKVEYDLIAIPGEVLRREVRQTGHNYGPFEQSLEDAIRKKSLVKAANPHSPQNPHDEVNNNVNTGNTDSSGVTYNGNSVVQTLLDSAKTNADPNLHTNEHDKRSFFGSNDNNDSGESFLIGSFGSSSSGSTSSSTSSSSSSSGGVKPSAQDVLRTVGNVINTGSTIVRGVERVVNKFGGSGASSTTTSTTNEGGGGLGGTIKKILRTKLSLVGIGGGNNAASTATTTSSGTSPGAVLGNVGQAIAIGSTVVGGLSTVIGKLNRQNGGGGGGSSPLSGIAEIPGNIVEGIRNLKQNEGSSVQDGIRSFTSAATDGLRFVGRLSSSILRILLQIPAIKARVITEAVQAATPVKTTISDVIGENAEDMRTIVESGSEMIRDAIDILINIVSQVLAFQGRVLAKFGSNSLDASSNIFDGGLRVGGAVVQAAGDVASAVGRGVGDVVQVVSEADVPPLPQLPQLPQLPKLGSLFGGNSGSTSTVITSSSSSTHYNDNNSNNNKPFDVFGGRRRRRFIDTSNIHKGSLETSNIQRGFVETFDIHKRFIDISDNHRRFVETSNTHRESNGNQSKGTPRLQHH
ncbi:hypothetical protein FHG87_015586 [Trinorchestia longiramus]|nr:hypothetical protein FHG87_015586 [Trinorchestia longiramus]